MATQAELNINYVDNEDFSESLKQIILNELFKKYPNSIEIFENLIEQYSSKKSSKQPADFSYIYGKLMKNDVPVISENKLQNFDSSVKKSIDDQPITTLKAKAVEEIISLEIDKKQKEDYVMLHNFEKVETAEEFNGNWRDFDGSDEIAKHENAIEDLSMKYTVRVDDTAHSVYQSDFIENTSVSESVEMDTTGCFLKYDEWDFERFQYKQNFCRVYPKTQLKSNPNYYHKTIKNNATLLNNLRKTLANLNNKMQEQKRQTQGYDFDIDALTDLFVDVHSKKNTFR